MDQSLEMQSYLNRSAIGRRAIWEKHSVSVAPFRREIVDNNLNSVLNDVLMVQRWLYRSSVWDSSL